MPVVGSGALSCPEREALGTGELGKECPFGGKPKYRTIFPAACEAGPALWSPWLSGREMCFPGSLPLEGESIAPVKPLPLARGHVHAEDLAACSSSRLPHPKGT